MDSAHPDYVYKLYKSLYGLKQAPKAWFERFAFHLLHLGFTASMADSSLFIIYSANTIIFLLLYVDDIIVTGNDSTQVHNLIAALTFTPDIAFSVHQLFQFMSHPTSTHFEVAKRFLRYIKGTLHFGISFTPGPLTLTVFSDADWTGDPKNRRSTTRLLVFPGPNPISWSAKK